MRLFKVYSTLILSVSLFFFGLSANTSAASTSLLTRGPYLQMQTDDSITIHWRTDVATDSVVSFGTSAGNLINTVTEAGSRINHAVVLNNLGANQHYWYSVGDSIGTIAGDSSYHFYTAPIQGDPADTRIWVWGFPARQTQMRGQFVMPTNPGLHQTLQILF